MMKPTNKVSVSFVFYKDNTVFATEKKYIMIKSIDRVFSRLFRYYRDNHQCDKAECLGYKGG
jgi:hypothetical protein